MKLNVLALGITLGICWGVGLFLMPWWIIMFDGPLSEPTIIGRCYRGYTVTAEGSVIGLIWALVDGFIAGAIIAWVYNFVVDRIPASPAAEKAKA